VVFLASYKRSMKKLASNKNPFRKQVYTNKVLMQGTIYHRKQT